MTKSDLNEIPVVHLRLITLLDNYDSTLTNQISLRYYCAVVRFVYSLFDDNIFN